MFVLDSDGLIEAVSPGCCSLMEVDQPAELVGKHLPDFLLPEWRAPAVEAIQRAGAGVPTRFHAGSLTLKGNLRTFDATVGPFYDAGGAVARVIVRKSDADRSSSSDLEHRLLAKDEALAALTLQLDVQKRQLTDASLLATHSQKIRVMCQVVGSVVHDINNVLIGTTIGLYLPRAPDQR